MRLTSAAELPGSQYAANSAHASFASINPEPSAFFGALGQEAVLNRGQPSYYIRRQLTGVRFVEGGTKFADDLRVEHVIDFCHACVPRAGFAGAARGPTS